MERPWKLTSQPAPTSLLMTRARDLSLFKIVAAMSGTKRDATLREERSAIGVLIIEEGFALAAAVADDLRHCGFVVRSASSYVRGLELFHNACDETDVVILDVTQDHLSARYTFQLLRRVHPFVKIFLASDGGSSQHLSDLLDPQATCILEKPLPTLRRSPTGCGYSQRLEPLAKLNSRHPPTAPEHDQCERTC